MIREATLEDAAGIEAFLSKTPETTMFLRSNLAHGVGAGDHRHATRYFLWMIRGGIAGVFGLTADGFLLAQIPPEITACYPAFANAIAGETVLGMTGTSHCVVAALKALGLEDAAYSLNHDEPLMRASLKHLPDTEASVRRPDPADAEMLKEWFATYEMDTGITSSEDIARTHAETRVKAALRPDTPVRILIEDGAAVGMAAINARLADVVQVGGVFVPTLLRKRGYGRRVTAALLAEARCDGAKTAILFANNAAAERAYEAIGFETIGTYRVALLQSPQTIAVAA
ncbi:MAG: GNAT family N-acetyltransferase [Pseudomonadota bacterium]